MAIKKKTTRKSSATKGGRDSKKFSVNGFSTGMNGFRTKGKNATKDGVNVTFDQLVHFIQDDMAKRTGVKLSLDLIKNCVYFVGGAIADNLAKGDKVCVSVPELGSFKTSVRKYSIGGKQGRTKTVKFTPNSAFKANAKLGTK